MMLMSFSRSCSRFATGHLDRVLRVVAMVSGHREGVVTRDGIAVMQVEIVW